MEIIIIFVLCAVSISLYIAAKKKWIDNLTFQRIAGIASILSLIVALYVLIDSYEKKEDPQLVTNKKNNYNSESNKNIEKSPLEEPSPVVIEESPNSLDSLELIINISREVNEPYVYVDGTLIDKAYKCRLLLLEGLHEVQVYYRDNLDFKYEYSDSINVRSNMTFNIKKNMFKLRQGQ